MLPEIKKVIVHGIGNKVYSEGLTLSKSEIPITKEVKGILCSFIESSKMSEATYQFFHESNELGLNPLFVYSNRIFSDENSFLESSQNIARHLYESSDHPKIHHGEVIIILFECEYNGTRCQALGLLKSESKDKYLNLEYHGGGYHLDNKEGLSVNTIDKGAFIFNFSEDSGFRVNILMRSNKQVDTKYWTNDFLHIRQINDSFYKTQQVISLTKGYVREVLEETKVPIVERAEILARASGYFASNDAYDDTTFRKEVFRDDNQSEVFAQYRDEVLGIDNESYDGFEINKTSQKIASRSMKSVIKLDKNFHIYIHGGEGMIKRGYDETTGLEYYQLYFQREE